MSHPDPKADLENMKKHDPHEMVPKKRPSLGTLKAMVAQPASKEWFIKHGTPKSKALNKAKK